jgi:ribosomal protein S18 acetylase RimI-like enzyme
MLMPALSIGKYERRYREPVLHLLASSYQIHTHLDWYNTEQWLDSENVPVWLAWQADKLVGMIAASIPLSNTCWMRLLAIHDAAPTEAVLTALWETLRNDLKTIGVGSVSLLITHDWLSDYASPIFSMSRIDTIVTMRRRSAQPPRPRNVALTVQPAEIEDYPVMTEIDQAAFPPPWQLAFSDLRQAARIAVNCTVARLDGEIVGYQLSTRHRETGHLARLAVLPEMQGKGVGGTLLYYMIRSFLMKGVRVMTVNTQLSNVRSQRLYGAYHFLRNGYDMPVWEVEI